MKKGTSLDRRTGKAFFILGFLLLILPFFLIETGWEFATFFIVLGWIIGIGILVIGLLFFAAEP